MTDQQKDCFSLKENALIKWLWNTLEKCTGFREVSLDDLLSKVPFDISEHDLGRAIQWAFPYAKRERKGKRKCCVYSNIKNITTKKAFSNTSWEEFFNTYTPPKPDKCTMSWTLMKKFDNEFIQWMIVPSDDLCEGNLMVRELRISKDFSITFFIMGKQVFSLDNEKDITKEFLDNVFEFCAVVAECKGFEVKIQGSVKNKEGAVIGVTEQWQINDENGAKIRSLRHRAVDCVLICNERESKCRNCENIRSHCHRRLNNVQCESDERQVKKKRISYMSPEELTSRLQAEQIRAKNAEKRAERATKMKKDIKDQMDQFTEDDHNDFKAMFAGLEGNNIPEEMRMFWEAQKEVLEKPDARGNRWHPKIISLCLSVWTRSPDAYQQLQESGMFKLPSGRLLSLYKNSVRQSAGLNDDVLDWLVKEADKSNLDEYGREGGLILDEMSIQEDLQIKSENGVKRLVGLVDLGKEHNSMKALSTGEEKAELATHVCQFVFLGNTGFRFPFAHWPTKEVDSATLYILFWKAVSKLLLRGINIVYCCCDGGEANRGFINIHFDGKDPVKEKFTIRNRYTREPLIFILDFSHNIKKLRNNLSKSKHGGSRKLTVNSQRISWRQWVDAFNWDQKTNSLPVHYRLTVKHFQLGYSSKMRNHLAEQVLNKDMLELMKAYKDDLEHKAGKPVNDLDQAIKFLEVTSVLIKNFTSRQCYTSMADHRLVENDNCLEWLQQWQSEVKARKDLKASERNKLFLSDKTMNDVTSCILGFKELCRFSFQAHPGCRVSACRVNSDLVENVFCQQRGNNGQNDNPTYVQYGPSMNSILLGQTTTTKKGNTGKVDRYAFNKPQKLPVKRKEAKRKLSYGTADVEPANVPDQSGTSCSVCVKEFLFPAEVSQSTLGVWNQCIIQCKVQVYLM